jgi:hypothetical protein
MASGDSERPGGPVGSRGTAPDTLERIVASVPALRKAGLDSVADSILSVAHDAEVERARASAPRTGKTTPRRAPAKQRRKPVAAQGATSRPSRRPSNATPPASEETGSEGVSPAAAAPVVRPETASTRWRLHVGSVLLVLAAGVGHARIRVGRLTRASRFVLARRRDLVLGTFAVSTMSLLVGWVITRLP